MIIFRFSAIRDLFRFDVWAAAQELNIALFFNLGGISYILKILEK